MEEDPNTLRIKLPIPPGQERVPADVINAVILYKMLKELREIRDEVEGVRKALTSRGEVLPLDVDVVGEKEVEPGYGFWRSVSVYNEGPNECLIQIRRDMPLVRVGVNESRSWSFPTEVIKSLYIKCLGNSRLSLEFLR